MSTALATRGLDKSFGSLVVAKDIALSAAAGRALRADRPERRRQDHADQPDDRHAAARRRPDPPRRRATSPRSRRTSASSAGWCARSRSTRCSRNLNALEAVTLAVCEREGVRGTWWRRLPAYSARDRRGLRDPGLAAARHATAIAADARARLRPAAPARDRARARHQAEGAAARRAGGRRAEGRERRAVRGDRQPVARHHGAVHRARHERRVPLRQPHHRDGRRPHPGRGHAGRDRRRPARARGLSRQARTGAMAEPLLALRRRARRLRRRGRARRRLARGAGAGQPRGARPQRRRQDARCSSPSWATPALRAARSCWRGEDITRLPPHRRARARHRLGGAGARDLPLAHRGGEPHRRGAARPLGPEGGLRAVSAPRRAPRATWATSSPAASSRCSRSRAR